MIEKVIDIEFNLLKREVEKFRHQTKSLDIENRTLEDLVEVLKNPIDLCESIIAFR